MMNPSDTVVYCKIIIRDNRKICQEQSQTNTSHPTEMTERSRGEAQQNPDTQNASGVAYGFTDSNTSMANDVLLPYGEEIKGYIESRGDYIVDNYEKLVGVVDTAFDNPKEQATCYFGIIRADILETIRNDVPNLPQNEKLFKTGKDYSVAATLDSIRHITENKTSMTRADVV
ncbi:MAG: hypothetical protein IKV35_04880, partial [Clostridia bacterium]|nr:hypothetical protein [Clostridia bacterium]